MQQNKQAVDERKLKLFHDFDFTQLILVRNVFNAYYKINKQLKLQILFDRIKFAIS